MGGSQNFTESQKEKLRTESKPVPIRPNQNGLQTMLKRSIPISKPITITKSNLVKTPASLAQSQNLLAQLGNQLTAQNLLLKPSSSISLFNSNSGQTVRIAPRLEKPVLPESPPKPVIPAEPISKEQQLADLREKAVAIKTCMKLSMEEVEALILGGKVVKVVSNRKKPDQTLKYPCKFCVWFHFDTNGDVKQRSFGRKEEIKRHHMLHLRYERFQCQYCPYKVVRSDHLHRHMKNKHPEVDHPGPQSNRRKQLQIATGDFENDTFSAKFPGLEYSSASFNEFPSFNETTVVEEEDDDEFMSNLQPKLNDNESANDDTALTAEAIKSLISSGTLQGDLGTLCAKLLSKSEPQNDSDDNQLVIDTSEDTTVKSEIIDEEPQVKRIKF